MSRAPVLGRLWLLPIIRSSKYRALPAVYALCLAMAVGCDKADSDKPGVVDELKSALITDVEYYKMVDEVMAEPDAWTGKLLRVHGYVEAGSIAEQRAEHEVRLRFVMEQKGARLVVEHAGPAPDTFKDLAEVVAKGRIVRVGDGYVLRSTELLAKCPSKYDGRSEGPSSPSNRPKNVF